MKKAIFLDFDGVLNSIDSSIASKSFQESISTRFYEVDNVRLGLLKWLCEITNAEIIISSSWRIGKSIDWFIGFFEARRWAMPPIVGLTDQLNCIRGGEIEEFLKTNTYDKYVIFDDDRDFFDYQPLIHANRTSGLTINHIFYAIDILTLRDDLSEDELIHINELRKHVEFENEY